MPRPGPRSRRRRLGQHFLTDARVLERQIRYAELGSDDVVLEIGPGLGALTERLASRVRRVIAVELDPRMLSELERRGISRRNVQLHRADAAQLDYATLGTFNKIVANLPYAASSPITFRLLRTPFDVAILMYQHEFAERLVASPGSPEFGRLAAARAYYARAELLERVPPGAFRPPPRVDSAIVRLVRHPEPPFAVHSPESFEALLRILFSTRRKTIRSTLRRGHRSLGLPSWLAVEAALSARGLAGRRPEELTPPELGALDVALGRLRPG